MPNYPKLHNATWPGVVGKGAGSEPPISLIDMLDLTAAARCGATRFDGVDLFLADPHVSIDSTSDDLARLVDDVRERHLAIGSLVAPVWPPTGGGSAMGDSAERERFLTQVRKACRIAQSLREMGIRPSGVVRIDSACSVADWARDPVGNTRLIADTLRRACDIAADHDEQLAIEGEICWGGMHSWRHVVDLLEAVNRPERLGFQADMAHTLLFLMGYNAPESRLLPEGFDWNDDKVFYAAYAQMTDQLRPWTIDFHVAQNNGEVFGSGSHDKTGRHCLPSDPGGKLDVVRCAGSWLTAERRPLIRHICWDGCMFPNAVLTSPATWNEILATMVAVRDAHGWNVHSA